MKLTLYRRVHYDGATIVVDDLLAEAWLTLRGLFDDLIAAGALGVIGHPVEVCGPRAREGHEVTARILNRLHWLQDPDRRDLIAMRAGVMMGTLDIAGDSRDPVADRNAAQLRRWIAELCGLLAVHGIADHVHELAAEIRRAAAATSESGTKENDPHQR